MPEYKSFVSPSICVERPSVCLIASPLPPSSLFFSDMPAKKRAKPQKEEDYEQENEILNAPPSPRASPIKKPRREEKKAQSEKAQTKSKEPVKQHVDESEATLELPSASEIREMEELDLKQSESAKSASASSAAASASAASSSSASASASASASESAAGAEPDAFSGGISDSDLLQAADDAEQAQADDLKLKDAEKVYVKSDPAYFKNFILPDGSLALDFKRVQYPIRGKTITKTIMYDTRDKNSSRAVKVRTPFMLLGHATEAFPFGTWDPFTTRKNKKAELKCILPEKAKLSFHVTTKAWNSHRRLENGNDPVAEEFRKFCRQLNRKYMAWAKDNRDRAKSSWNAFSSSDINVDGVKAKLGRKLGKEPDAQQLKDGMFEAWYNTLPKKFFASKKDQNAVIATEEEGDSIFVSDYAMTMFEPPKGSTNHLTKVSDIKIRPHCAAKDKFYQSCLAQLLNPQDKNTKPLYPNNKPLRDGAVLLQDKTHAIIPWADRSSVSSGSVVSLLLSWSDDIETKPDSPTYGILTFEEGTRIKSNVREVATTIEEAVPGAKPMEVSAEPVLPTLPDGTPLANPFSAEYRAQLKAIADNKSGGSGSGGASSSVPLLK